MALEKYKQIIQPHHLNLFNCSDSKNEYHVERENNDTKNKRNSFNGVGVRNLKQISLQILKTIFHQILAPYNRKDLYQIRKTTLTLPTITQTERLIKLNEK